MDLVLAAADLVVSRAGASTLAELTAAGVPSILLPYPYHRDQHQLKNAQVLLDAGAARVVTDACDPVRTGANLAQALTECRDQAVLSRMAAAAQSLARPEAAATVASEMLKF